MTKCNNCVICPFVRESKTVQSTASKCTVDINRPVNCQTRNILYCITCTKCSFGESERTLKERFSEHKGYVVNNKITKATGEHFNQKEHKVSDMSVTVLENVFSSDPAKINISFGINIQKMMSGSKNIWIRAINKE